MVSNYCLRFSGESTRCLLSSSDVRRPQRKGSIAVVPYAAMKSRCLLRLHFIFGVPKIGNKGTDIQSVKRNILIVVNTAFIPTDICPPP